MIESALFRFDNGLDGNRIKHLERELEIARQERDVLKKAVAFFAKQS